MAIDKLVFDKRFLALALLTLAAVYWVPGAFRVSAIALAIVLVVLAPLPAATRPVVSAVILGLATGVASINLFAPQIFQKHVIAEFGWQQPQFALATAIATLVTVISSPLIGRLFDRQGVRRWAIVSIVLLAALLISLRWLTPNLWHLYLVMGLMPLLAAGTSSVAYSRIIARWFDRRRGQAFGAALAGIGVGGAVLGPTIGWLIAHYGWRDAYASLGLLGLLLTLPVVLWALRDSPAECGLGFDGLPAAAATASNAPARPAVIYGYAAPESRRQPRFWLMLMAFVIMSFGIGGVMVQLVPILIARGIPEATAVQTLGALSIGLIAGRAFAGFLMDRLFAPYVAATIVLLPAIGAALLAMGADATGAFVAAMLVGLAAGAELDVIAVLVTRYFGNRAYAENYGWQYAAWTLGSGTGQLLTTAAYQRLGTHTQVLWLYATLFVISGVLVYAWVPTPI